MIFFSVSRCGETLSEKTIQLLVEGVFVCVRARSWIPVDQIRSLGARLKRAKAGSWGCVQAHEVWSTEEESHLSPGHFWIWKFGTVPGSMSCVEEKFELQTRKWEEYRGTRYYDGKKTLVVELWLHRVADDLSGLTFQEWDPSEDTDDVSVPVSMFVNLTELRAADFHLTEVSPLQLDVVVRGGRRTHGAVVRKFQVVGNSTLTIHNDS